MGVIVKVSTEEFRGSRAKGARKLAPGEVDYVVTVLSAHTGALCDYVSSDLRYADGSLLGPVSTQVMLASLSNADQKISISVVPSLPVSNHCQLRINPGGN